MLDPLSAPAKLCLPGLHLRSRQQCTYCLRFHTSILAVRCTHNSSLSDKTAAFELDHVPEETLDLSLRKQRASILRGAVSWLAKYPFRSRPRPLTCSYISFPIRDGFCPRMSFYPLFWPDAFVEESNLAQQMSLLRKAVAEAGVKESLIITIPGRGYQFVAPVESVFAESVSREPELLPGLPSQAADAELILQAIRSKTTVVVEKSSTEMPAPEGIGGAVNFCRHRDFARAQRSFWCWPRWADFTPGCSALVRFCARCCSRSLKTTQASPHSTTCLRQVSALTLSSPPLSR